MKQSSIRKRARRLLMELKELQKDDYSVTPSTIFAIKHLLQFHNRCKFVEVKIDSFAANSPFEFDRSLLPKFIVSQLEGQRLTNRDSEKIPVPPIVAFAIQLLPSVTCCGKSYPTLFRWHYAPRHRTYYVFAHIKHNMGRQTYTLTELMGLRTDRVPDEVLAMANNPEIGTLNAFIFVPCHVVGLTHLHQLR